MHVAELYETELRGGATDPFPPATGEVRHSTHLHVSPEQSINIPKTLYSALSAQE